MPFGRKSPLEALALPGVILAYKYSQFRQRRREAASRRVTERELSALHHKIDKLLSKLEESEPEPPTSQEDECVICINARATMQTSPCGHRVVCRRCFVKTIQSAVAQRLLPLRCVICRTRVSRLTTGSGTFRLQGSSSTYSMGSKSWNVPGSASSYSVGSRVAASASLYSMSSGSSCMSNASHTTNSSGTSHKSGSSSVTSSSCTSDTSNNLSSSDHRSNVNGNHKHHDNCSSVGCLGAIPRNPSYRQNSLQYPTSSSSSSASSHHTHHHQSRLRYPDMPNRLPPIKEYKSPTRSSRLPTPSPVHMSNPKYRFASYTQPSKPHPAESAPLLSGESSTGKSGAAGTSSKLGMSSKIAPMNTLKSPINKNTMITGGGKKILNPPTPVSSRVISASASANQAANGSNEKNDNKKNESAAERKKKEEKLKAKAEKEARKEEKRIAKEEERLAKMLAKEEKKRGKKEAKEALLAADNGRK